MILVIPRLHVGVPIKMTASSQKATVRNRYPNKAMPETPVKEPETKPKPKTPPPAPKPESNPFEPDWPETRPAPQPKAAI